ncbi:hypothetical protein KP509_22G072500 [Ceratopteris richardii]|uniref:Uncharacterized protein n=1 Tax=Ceratopteris richardii TaxID=49495 RepID=A0A8T2S909_CERRI|nr:hypothetical protein KP509_22G072500 [Ceratopteris richardii]
MPCPLIKQNIMQNAACRFAISILWGSLFTSYFLQVSDCEVSLKYSILPKWVDSYNAEPNVTLRVCFSEDRCIKDDDVLSIPDIRDRPDVKMSGNGLDTSASYMMCMLDADANNPHHPVYKPMLHWMVCDLPGDVNPHEDLGICGHTVKPYAHPGQWDSAKDVFGVHRMYTLLFKQERKMGYLDLELGAGSLNMRRFTKQFNLSYPVAGISFHVDTK